QYRIMELSSIPNNIKIEKQISQKVYSSTYKELKCTRTCLFGDDVSKVEDVYIKYKFI
ncbi:hypothetical protein ACJX0J_020467, partial [Zea mays]